jgi:hypothetical protein
VYTLIINVPELKPSNQEVAKMLEILLKKYIAVPFKSRYFVSEGKVITIMQFKRLGNNIPGWDSVQYVDSYEEAVEKSQK